MSAKAGMPSKKQPVKKSVNIDWDKVLKYASQGVRLNCSGIGMWGRVPAECLQDPDPPPAPRPPSKPRNTPKPKIPSPP